MAYDYGFGILENELIELFNSESPDFEKAKELLKAGADVNSFNEEQTENVLSATLNEYIRECVIFANVDSSEKENLDSLYGITMCNIIRFFLEYGFDVSKHNYVFGAQCLFSLVLSTYDRYMIEASKLLFDAGAKNRTISDKAGEDETPWDFVGTEGSFQDTCEGDHALGNLYEALYQIYQAVDEGKPYNGIDSYECAVGKKIIKVLASPNNDKPSIFYSLDLSTFKKENCFTSDLYFIYDGGALRITKYADFWVDSILPEAELVDVSAYFSSIVGSEIKSFSFSSDAVHVENVGVCVRPIATIEMESGRRMTFSINYGDVQEEERAAFFELN